MSSKSPGAVGPYSLELRQLGFQHLRINVGQTVNGTLDVLDPLTTCATFVPENNAPTCYVEYWDFTLTSPQTLTISMNSSS